MQNVGEVGKKKGWETTGSIGARPEMNPHKVRSGYTPGRSPNGKGDS